jgi:hypothetical protein
VLASEAPPADIGGVLSSRHGVAYTTTNFEAAGGPTAELKFVKKDGTVKTIADLRAFEEANNPDGDTTYGFLDLDAACTAELEATLPPEVLGFLLPYTGIVDAHPYALAKAPRGGWYVADAGGNDILWVSPRGRIKVVYVAEPQLTEATPELVAALEGSFEGLDVPDCVLGSTYAFEPVPTDVEVARSGHLYVSQLPGGPEDPSAGARGSVVRVNPWNGHDKVVATGLAGATNVALGRHGEVYVAEMFGNRISVVKHHRVRTVVELPTPAAVEYVRGKLVVSANVFEDGQIVIVKR